MSQVATNLYALLDNELERMHSFLQRANQDPYYGNATSRSTFQQFGSPSHHSMEAVYNRILAIQNIMLEALKIHDSAIQAKVAELALTGDSNETK